MTESEIGRGIDGKTKMECTWFQKGEKNTGVFAEEAIEKKMVRGVGSNSIPTTYR